MRTISNQKYEITDMAHEEYPFLHRIRALRDICGEISKICPKTARNPSPGQGRRPAPKEATQRLTEANMGVHWSVLAAVAAPAGVPLRKPAVGSVAP